MKAIIMAGGKGTRLSPMKPFLEVCGKPMIQRVYDIAHKFAETVFIATVPSNPVYIEIVKTFNNVILTSGKGYEFDVIEAINRVGFPVLVFPSDTPFIPDRAIYTLLACQRDICTLFSRGKYVGISFWRKFGDDYEDVVIDYEISNVNTKEDLEKINKSCI
ncbi:NTP transferase domain-containing protein [Acidianus sp. RZ1]|uniref:NTP transferase domain-containing protein n=1 Tax=Acidianus sp. RZ1 TaxID=1540082 RepID=UPI0018120754|nr:NTP transferase domain-containing protein [Acidianus sp. RZ1]NON62902.1 NTP transferase domain-containing protein [Acidianus sp. RZ1]